VAITRCAALLLPLFSARTRTDAGIGDIAAIPAIADLARDCGCTVIQLLPIGECVHGDSSPYSSRSAFAIDPVYVGLDAVPELADGAWRKEVGRHVLAALERARAAPRVDYAAVRFVKERALALAFARFRDREWASRSARAKALLAFVEEERAWLPDFALYRALEETHANAPWTSWPAPLRDRDPAALEARRAALADLVLWFTWLQWTASTQWFEARRAAASRGVKLAGDLPFMVASESADAWAHPEEFRIDASVGAPPDALAPEGQDWDLPPYDWPVHERTGDRWIKDRAHRSAELYDLYRVDHVVGYYRTYVIERRSGARGFHPSEEPAQKAQGERVLRAMMSAGADLIAEDLGTIPKFVRKSLVDMKLPGYRVVRWERKWDEPGQPFIDPRTYGRATVATTGTHDTNNLVTWWEEECRPEDRRAICELPTLRRFLDRLDGDARAYTDEVREAMLDLCAGAESDLAILPLQDILGIPDQVNVPGTVSPGNWSWRLPFTLEERLADPARRSKLEGFRRACERHGRVG
jgi:4-alpha-glucanotransferase